MKFTSKQFLAALAVLSTWPGKLLGFQSKASSPAARPVLPRAPTRTGPGLADWRRVHRVPLFESVHPTAQRLIVAARRHEMLTLRYWGGSTPGMTRSISPGLVFQLGGHGPLYVSGYCHLRREERVFRVERWSCWRQRTTSFASRNESNEDGEAEWNSPRLVQDLRSKVRPGKAAALRSLRFLVQSLQRKSGEPAAPPCPVPQSKSFKPQILKFMKPTLASLSSMLITIVALSGWSGCATKPIAASSGPIMAEVLAASRPDDWRSLAPEQTLYLELTTGRVVIELAPTFAPNHVANIKALAREHYYDGLAILRVQDNYVVQWGDPNSEKPEQARKVQQAKRTLPAEFDRALDTKLPFTPLPDGDVYAPEVGFSDAFPVARDRRSGRMWLVHRYGMVGSGRDNAADSGGGTELFVVIGHAPRHLDRNDTLFGRVVQGIELLSALPRSPAPMGFYD